MFSGHRGRDHERRKWAESAPTEVVPRRTGVRAKSRQSMACEGDSLPEAEVPPRQVYGQISTHGAASTVSGVPPRICQRRQGRPGYVKAAPERMVWSSDCHTRLNMRTPSRTTRFCSTPGQLGAGRGDPKSHPGRQSGGALWVRLKRAQGQIYPPLSGALKQPTDSGKSVFGSQSTALGKKIAKAIVTKKIT